MAQRSKVINSRLNYHCSHLITKSNWPFKLRLCQFLLAFIMPIISEIICLLSPKTPRTSLLTEYLRFTLPSARRPQVMHLLWCLWRTTSFLTQEHRRWQKQAKSVKRMTKPRIGNIKNVQCGPMQLKNTCTITDYNARSRELSWLRT